MVGDEAKYYAEVGKRIKSTRIRRGMSMEDLADQAGYSSRSSIHKIEHGHVGVSVQRISRLAHVLGVSPIWLATGENDDVSSSQTAHAVVPSTHHKKDVASSKVQGDVVIDSAHFGNIIVELKSLDTNELKTIQFYIDRLLDNRKEGDDNG